MEVLKDVVLHVYELETTPNQPEQQSTGIRALSFFSRMLPAMGMGAYHTSLEVMGDRYTFAANAGIVKTRSEREGIPHGASYKEAIQLGACSLQNRGELNEVVTKLSEFFHKTAYHLVHRNCNSFTETLATAIIMKDSLAEPGNHKLKYYPDWVNRLAKNSSAIVSHDADIVPCNVLQEARKAVGADTKVGWEFSSADKKNKGNSSRTSKKELSDKQRAMLEKIRKK